MARLADAVLAFALAGVCAACATTDGRDGLAEELDSTLEKFERDRGFSGAIVVEAGAHSILKKGYGFADRENRIPFTVDTVAQVGSLTKQFTAIAALLLADEGVLHLYKPVREYLPNAPEPGAGLTLHQLMTHSSGLPEYCGEDDFEPMSRDTLIARCLSLPLIFKPGSNSEYSNPGFSIVAAVIESVTGKDLETVLQEKVFTPNGMDATGYRFKDRKDLQFAYGYADNEKQEVISKRIATLGDDWWVLKGNGGIQASANDMRRWRRVLQGEGEIDRQTLQAFMTPRFPDDERVGIAYGWYVVSGDDGKIIQISHSGSDGVFFSYFWLNPRDDYFFYMVGNSGEEAARDAVREVRRILFEAGDGPPTF